MSSLESIINFYLVEIDNDHIPVHKGALLFPGKNTHLEIWQAPKNKRWHWTLQSHTVDSYVENPEDDGFLNAKLAMKAALDNGEVLSTVASWLDGEMLMDIAEHAQEMRERNKKRGL